MNIKSRHLNVSNYVLFIFICTLFLVNFSISTPNLRSLVSILTELSTFKDIIAKYRNLYTLY